MPEGPSIVILREETQRFVGATVQRVAGNTQEDVKQFSGRGITAVKSWGKHYLILFGERAIRIHFMLFGSYRIDEPKASPPRLSLCTDRGDLHFYACSVKVVENPEKSYDWQADVMNPRWNPRAAMKKLKAVPEMEICDALLDQEIFSGVGNIIKNEVLYRVRVHPESLTGKIPIAKLRSIVAEARTYSFEFLEWKKKFELKKHWLAHTKKKCLRCDLPIYKKITGKKKRRSFFCTNCQKSY